MSKIVSEYPNLRDRVNTLLQLAARDPELRAKEDVTAIEASLRKAIAPKFEIAFAGAFSAGKSMLINALLERELLYSAEGHATGTECYLEYAESDRERVVLTFLSEAEIREQVNALAFKLGLNLDANLDRPEAVSAIEHACLEIIEREGGESKSELAKQAQALLLLLGGYQTNRDRLHATDNATYLMEQFDFTNLQQATRYARRGSNSAVLKRLEYYCYHPLLEDGNVLIDMPGIDAPVKKDAELTYRKIEDPETSAVVCVLKPASEGDMTAEETEMLERMRQNPGIRDRVFFVFNRIDETWYNSQLRQRLDDLIATQFRDTRRVYKTSGLLGFYGSQLKYTSGRDRFGLDSIFADSVQTSEFGEDTPQFVNEFNRYCANSGKLSASRFRISVNSFETPNENYTRILSEWGTELIEKLVDDSGIEEFREAITRYLREEKRPQLFANLADDLQPLCIDLRKHYLALRRNLDSQPREIESMKARELERLNQELQQVGEEFRQHMAREVNQVVTDECSAFREDFRKLKAKMVSRLDELLQTFSVSAAYSRATLSHPRNATAPLIAILVEALYSIANDLENVLVEASQWLIDSYFQRLIDRIRQAEYYRKLYRLLGNDGGLEACARKLQATVAQALVSEARTECDRYVRESPRFYDEGTFSIYQFRRTLQQTSQGYDCESMVDAEPAIRQLLKLDFEPKVSATIRRNFRQTINQTLKTQILPAAATQADDILQQYNRARAYLAQTLEKEAAEKIAQNQRIQGQTDRKIEEYNGAVTEINQCLQSMQLYEHQLPTIPSGETDGSDEVETAEFAGDSPDLERSELSDLL